MIEKNKNCPLPSHAGVWNWNKKKCKEKKLNCYEIVTLKSSNSLQKIQSNPLITFVIEVIIFPHKNIKKTRKFLSDNSRMKKDMESRFPCLTQKINVSYLLWTPQDLLLALESQKKMKHCKSAVMTKK